MHRSIDYYFSLVSPWAYIGHATFMNLTQRHSLDVNFKPVSLPTIFAETGGLPLNKRAPDQTPGLLDHDPPPNAARRQSHAIASLSSKRSLAAGPTRAPAGVDQRE